MSQTDEEFDEFLLAAWPKLRQAAYALTGSADTAEDLLQTVLARTYEKWRRVRADDPVAYVRRALLNAYVDSWRRRRRIDERPTDSPPDQASYDDDAIDDRADLAARLAALSERERTVVVMRYYLDLPVEDVAAALGCSTGTVKSTASRTLARLRTRAMTQEETRP